MHASITQTDSCRLYAPFLEHLKIAEVEAYQCIDQASSPFDLLKELKGQAKEELKSSSFFSRIYNHYIGIHQCMDRGIEERKIKLIAEDHNLTELCQALHLSVETQEEIASQLDSLTFNRVEILQHLSELNSMQCFSKMGFSLLATGLSFWFGTKIIADLPFCERMSDTLELQNLYNAQCPSFSNPSYFINTSLYVFFPVLAIYQFLMQASDSGLLGALFSNPLTESASSCSRIALSSLIRISSIKDRILNCIRD